VEGALPDSKDASHRKKTTLRTFRFPVELANGLEALAEEQGVTLNALVSSVLTKHIDWEAKATKFGFIPVYKQIFKNLIEKLDNEALDRLGRTVLLPLWEEMASFWLEDSSPDRVLDLLSLRGRILPYLQTEVKKEGHKRTVIIHQDLDPSWSVVTRGALDELVRTRFHSQPRISVGETMVIAEFSIP
jgi:hypothetical protein